MPTRALLFIAALLIPVGGFAAGDDRQQPVNLRADRIEINQKNKTSLYRGHVVLTQGTLRLTAARADTRQRGSQVETVTAQGAPVTFRHRPTGAVEYLEGKAGRAHYQVPQRRIDLYENVTMQRGRDMFRGAVVHYDIESRGLIAEGNAEQRVYVALVPRAPVAEAIKGSP